MRRAGIMVFGLALAIAAASSDLAATSEVRANANDLLTHFYALLTPRIEPGMLALTGSGIFALFGTVTRRRDRQGL
jgi:hypothetical protein